MKSRLAKRNQRMIELTVRFWTNGLSGKKSEIRPKHAWCSGMVSMPKNESHDIEAMRPKPFHSTMDLPRVIEKVLIAHGVKLHRNRTTEKYIE